jgi:putative PIN family toxin of toxin-antitoxin system
LRGFLDTNVLASAFASRGLCADLFELISLEHELVIGARVLMELRRSLRQKIKLPATRCDEIVEFLREDASTVVKSAKPVEAAVDDDDALVLGEAIAGQAEVFVTGDAVIQRLVGINQMKILSPRGFWDYLHSQS